VPTPAANKPARRSLWVLLLIALGFIAARELGGPGSATFSSPIFFSAAAVLTLAALFTRNWPCRIALALAVLSASAGWYTLRILETPRHSLAALLPADPLAEPIVLTVEGTILERPRWREADRGEFDSPIAQAKWLVELDADTLITGPGRIPIRGRIRLYIGDDYGAITPDSTSLQPGQRIRTSGAMDPIRPRNNPGEFDLVSWAAQEHLAGSMSVPGARMIQPIISVWGEDALRASWLRWRAWLRDRADAALRPASIDPPTSAQTQSRALMRSLLLGERDPELRDVQSAFQNLGLIHLVAISGFNLAVMAFIALFVLRATGDRGWLEPALLALVVILYMLILPAQTPIIRSGLLVLALLLTEAGGRRYDRLTTLGWIGCALLLFKPLDLFSLGFQLSMGVTAALLWQGHRITDRLFGAELRGLIPDRSRTWDARLRRALRALWRTTKHAAAASLLSWSVATPLVLYHTGMLSPLAPLTTLLVLPVVTVVLWAGYFALVVGMFIPAAASLTGGFLDLLASFLIDFVLILDALPGMTLHLPRISLAWTLAATIVILWCFAHATRRSLAAWLSAAAILLWLIAEITLGPRLAMGGLGRDTALRIDTLNVGDGTCMLIRTPGEAVLWDCGSLTPRIGERTVQRAVRALGAGTVRTAIITHANIDHYSGLVDVAAPLGLRTVLVSRQFADEAASAPWSGPGRLLAALRGRNIEVRIVSAGDSFSLGGDGANAARIEFLWPPPDYSPRLINDASLVARISTAPNAPGLLLTGDIGPESIARILSREDTSDLANIAILELPHHGSINEPAIDFVRQLSPQVILQSTGPRRARQSHSGGHSTSQPGGWSLIRSDSPWHITARDGAAWAEISKDGAVRSGRWR
jgi:competence protein ComEC